MYQRHKNSHFFDALIIKYVLFLSKCLTFCYFVSRNIYQLITMKKKYWLATCVSLLLLTACGNGGDKKGVDEGKENTENVVSDEPMADSEQRDSINVKLGQHNYAVSIYRYPDKQQPLVIDELDQKFYDNTVEIKVMRDGSELLSKKISKEAFKDFLPAAEYKSGLLLGMSCDTARCANSTLCFTAQVGQAGEGPAFLVLVPVDGRAVSILRDNQQEDIIGNSREL